MLDVRAIEVAYGDALALQDVSLTIAERELVCVIGPNGAGKTTLVNALARLLPIRGGTLHFAGEDVTNASPHSLCDRGVAIIPEGRRLFTRMTVEENLDLGAYRAGARGYRAETLSFVYDLFPILLKRRRQMAGTMSGGEQQMVAIGRALMARPKLLLIDEPSLGLAPIVLDHVFEAIGKLHATGMSILLIEQSVARALAISERAYVLDCGRLIAAGPPAALLAEPFLREAYLGHGLAAPEGQG